MLVSIARRLPVGAVMLVLAAVMTGCATKSSQLRSDGDAAYMEGDYATAVAYYQQSIDEDPADPVTYHNLGLAYLNAGQPVKAETAYRNGVVVARDLPGWRVVLQDGVAEALFRQPGQEDQLFFYLQEQVDIYGLMEDYLRQGDVLVRMGDVDNAVAGYQGACGQAPAGEAAALVRFGDFYRSISADDKARLMYRYAYWVNPEYPDLTTRLRQVGFYPGPTAAIEPPAELKPLPAKRWKFLNKYEAPSEDRPLPSSGA